jgi:hypothetical protein
MCTERLVSPRMERRRFLGQVAAAGLAAGASTFPAISQEMTERRSSAAGNSQVSMADALARYATDLKYEDLPEDIVRTAKRTILDTFGCAFGGYTAGPSQIALDPIIRPETVVRWHRQGFCAY